MDSRACCWAASVAIGIGSGASGAHPPLASWFTDAADTAMIRRLEVASPPADAGRHVRQQHRWDPKLRMLMIDTTVTNSGTKTRRVGSVSLANWNLRIAGAPAQTGYRPLTYRKDTWYGSTYWTGPNWTRVGKDWHHPGIDTPSVRRFHVPRDGRVTVTGRACKADTNNGGGDGVRLSIRHNARVVWRAEINGDDAKGAEPKLPLDVRKGDSIRFAVHKRGRIFCDTTRWDPVVTFADGQRHQASKSFSTSKQGPGGWFYEMEVGRKAAVGLPHVYGLGRDLTLRQAAVGAAAAVDWTDRDAMPIAVLADGAGTSGVAMAVVGDGPWRLRCGLTREGKLNLQWLVGPGGPAKLPRLAVCAYRGEWTNGLTALQRVIGGGQDGTDLAMWAMILADWRRQDRLTDSAASYATATARHIGLAGKLLADLRAGRPGDFLAAEADELGRLADLAGRVGQDLPARRGLYVRVRRLKRRIALANPLMKFGKLLFCKRVPTSYSHLVMQYFGWRARPGGGLFVLDRPGYSLAAGNILKPKDAATFAAGNVLEPRLSYDARRVVFSWVACKSGGYNPAALQNDRDDGFYHIHEADVDPGAPGSPRQLTTGPFDDVMPTYLPSGEIVFCSTRRRGHARCFGGQFSRRWHVYTLHRMGPRGQGLRALSFHDTNEWFPAVSNDGLVMYARWDYIDRDAVTHQNLWATRPDGTNPVAVWGNATASPHCSFQVQPIPGSSKLVFTASAHHSITAGSIAVVDPDVARDGQAAITRITPEIPFPEAEGRNIREYYAAPWPLSDPSTGLGAGKYFLVAYSPTPLVWEPGANRPAALGIYLLDALGNRELIYRDPAIGSTNPRPLRPRPRPPVLSDTVAAAPTGEMLLVDVYEGLGTVPRGRVKQLRIVQIFPKTTNLADRPLIGLAREENARAILGTVPVEADGSARFLLPARTPVLFQALDADGLALQTMRSLTYVQPGERTSCVGCHEKPLTAPPRGGALALRRPPSKITPGPLDGQPFSFIRVVQPVLNKHCVKCHSGPKPKGPRGGLNLTAAPHRGFTKSYWSLCGDRNFWGRGTNPKNAAEALVPRFGGRNPVQVTPPGGLYGSPGSRLIRMLRKGHNKVKLTAADLARLASWIDCNAIFYGVYDAKQQAKQLANEPVGMPEIQ